MLRPCERQGAEREEEERVKDPYVDPEDNLDDGSQYTSNLKRLLRIEIPAEASIRAGAAG